MHCAACDADNPSTAKFCNACGARLGLACPNCGHINSAGSRFCTDCGGQLTAAPRGGARRAASRAGRAVDVHTAPSGGKDPGFPKRGRGRTQAGDRAVRRYQGFHRADTRAGHRGGAAAARRDGQGNDGGRASLRGHGKPGVGRRHHGTVRRADRPRGPRVARLLRRARAPGRNAPLRRAGPADSRRAGRCARRAEQRGSRRAPDQRRSSYGLQRDGPDRASCLSSRAAGARGNDAAHRRNAGAGRRLCPGPVGGSGRDQGFGRVRSSCSSWSGRASPERDCRRWRRAD